LFHSQERNRERNVKSYPERRCGQNHRPNRRRIIVDPGCDTDRGQAMSENDHVLESNVMLPRDVACKCINVPDHVRKIIRRPAFARRSAMTARVPRKHGDILKSNRVNRFLPPAGVLMSTMKKQEGLSGR